MRMFCIVTMALSLWGCSGLEKSEEEKIRRANLKSEPILRQEGEKVITIELPSSRAREPYSWELGSNSSKE